MAGIIIVFICVAIPVLSGCGLAGWKTLIESRPPDPYAVLAGRYAKGEIGEEEFARRMQILASGLQQVTLPPPGQF